MEATRIRLAEGVHLTYLPARKFKTSLLSAQFVTPLRRGDGGSQRAAGGGAAAGYGKLSRIWERFPHRWTTSTMPPSTTQCGKKAKTSAWALWPALLTIGYAPGGERLLEPAAELLGELICDPVTYHGRFVPEYFESEKTNLLEAIRVSHQR